MKTPQIKIQMRPEELFILSSIQVNPTQENLDRLNLLLTQITDWDYLTQLAISRQAAPFIYKKLPLLSNQNLVPETSKKQLQQAWFKTLSRSMVLIEHFSRLANTFNKAGLTFISMKGIYLSEWLYREVGLRQFSDIDLLVKEENGERALALLESLGYKAQISNLPDFISKKLATIHYAPMVLNGVSVEIHTRLHNNLTPYQVNLDELWENAEKINIHNADTYVFNIESLLITLSLHLDKHFKNKKFQFTGFYDIANLLNEYKSEINWTLFKTNCKNWNADKHVYPYLLLTHKYLGAHLPESVLNNAELDKQTENIFLNSMQGVIMREDNAQSNFNSIQHFQGNWAKLKFILNMIFPPPAYLMQRYKLKNSLSLIIYYPIRFFSELKLGLKVFFGYNK